LSKRERGDKVLEQNQQEYSEVVKYQPGIPWASILFIFGGLGLLLLGSRWLVNGAVEIASNLGVSDLVVGLTIIAAGTSLPEVATSVIASLRGERDIAVGNVVGSCIFNILFILGITATVGGSIPVEATATKFDIPVMIAVAIACLPIFLTGKKIDRWEGFVFLGYYIAYTAYIILASLRLQALNTFSNAMIWFVIPLTVLTLGIVMTREIKFHKENN
jgi:cation:H+ antiporter